MARAMTEAQLHRAVARFLALALPTEGCVWTTFPAGGGGKVRGANLKAAGLRAGWPDVQVLWRDLRMSNHGIFIGIELKTESGVLSREQIACHQAIQATGGLAYLCRSVLEVECVLLACGIPLRATAFGLGARRAA